MTDRELLTEILARVTRIEAALDRRGSSLCRADRAILEQLLPAIGGAMGSELFLSSEVCEHEAAGLRLLVCHGLTPRRLGRLLKRAAGMPVDGFVVERVAAEAGACLWRVLQVPEFPSLQNSGVPGKPIARAR